MKNHIFPFIWMRGEDESILREEIAKINECGIGALCVEARPHKDFCGPGWWHDMDIVIDECQKRNMKIWILDDKHFPTGYAAGLIEEKYPERKKLYLAETICDVFGGKRRVHIDVERMKRPTIGWWQIEDSFKNMEERAKNQIVAVTATRFTGRKEFSEESIDCTALVKDGILSVELPEGQWRVHVIYRTRTDGGNDAYINMLDFVSAGTQIEGVYEAHYQKYGHLFGNTIAGFFSDEPALGNLAMAVFDAKLGNDRMPLPWSDELEGMLKEKYGDRLNEVLPFLYVSSDSMKLCPEIRYDYMDAVSRLYAKNFSNQIGDWCSAHGVEYIGHVVEDMGAHSRLSYGTGHYFRAMEGQHMGGIDVIGSQVIFGAPYESRYSMGDLQVDGDFYHYYLGKLGASAGHLDPKKQGRTMVELFGAYGWSFGVRNMKYLLDHVLSRGENHLVPHAFSMADYPDQDCPPHFYARGNNGQYTWFRTLMKYANRMCDLLSEGTHIANCAVLYEGEADWVGNHMPGEKLTRVLTQNQVEFDIVPLDMLNNPDRYKAEFSADGFSVNGVQFDLLLVPYTEYAGPALIEFLKKNPQVPVWFVDGAPSFDIQGSAFDLPVHTVSLSDLPAFIEEKNLKAVKLSKEWPDLAVYAYEKNGRMFMLFNEEPNHAYQGDVLLPVKAPLAVYDGFRDCWLDMKGEITDAGTRVHLVLPEGGSIVIKEKKDEETVGTWVPWTELLRDKKPVDISENWKVSLARAIDYPAFGEAMDLKELVSVSDLDPKFSGIMKYEKTVELQEKPEQAFFTAENVYEVMRLTVNGTPAGDCLTPPYMVDISGLLKAGENRITVEAANTPARDQLNMPRPPFDFVHEVLEDSGMFGKIRLMIQ